jgi:hypothetical protein
VVEEYSVEMDGEDAAEMDAPGRDAPDLDASDLDASDLASDYEAGGAA